MKKIILFISCLFWSVSAVLAQDTTNYEPPTVNDIYASKTQSTQYNPYVDDYDETQYNNRQLQEFRPDIDYSEDFTNQCNYGYNGSDGSTMSY